MVVRKYLLLVTLCLICALTVHIISSSNQQSLQLGNHLPMQMKDNYKSLYFQVVDNIMSMLSERFADCRNFAFLDLVNPCMFKKWRKGVPRDMLQSLKCKYGPFFHIQSLENQLLFIYNDPDFHKDSPLKNIAIYL